MPTVQLEESREASTYSNESSELASEYKGILASEARDYNFRTVIIWRWKVAGEAAKRRVKS